MHDVAWQHRIGRHAGDHIRVAARGDEADVLAVGLVGDGQTKLAGEVPHGALGAIAQRKAQQFQLLAGGREEEIALVPVGVGGAVEGASAMAVVARAYIMTGRQHMGAKIAGGVEEIGEFDVLVAGDAGNRRFASHIAAGEGLDHLFPEPRLVIQDIMGNAQPFGHAPGVGYVLTGAAGALALGGGAMVVKLKGDAHDVVTLAFQQRRDDRGIHPAGHGHHDARIRRRAGEAERV